MRKKMRNVYLWYVGCCVVDWVYYYSDLKSGTFAWWFWWNLGRILLGEPSPRKLRRLHAKRS